MNPQVASDQQIQSNDPGFRCSSQQLRLCALRQNDGSGPYRSFLTARVPGTVNGEKLSRALQQLAGEIEILRTVYRNPSGIKEKFQFILPPEFCGITLDCLEGGPETDSASVAEQLLRMDFNWEQGPMLRCLLAPSAGHNSFVALAAAAISSDRRSLSSLMARLLSLYDGIAPFLSEEKSLQYADIAEWMAQASEDPDAEPGFRYWRERISRQPEARHICFARNTAVPGPFHPQRYSFRLHEKLSAALRRQETAEAILVTAWQTLLSALCEDDEVEVAVWHPGRDHELLAGAAGLFGQYLPGVAPVSGCESFSALTQQNARQIREAHLFQRYAGDVFAGPAGVPRGNDVRFLQYGFEYLADGLSEKIDRLKFDTVDSYYCGEPFLILLTTSPSGECSFTYDQEMLDETSVHEIRSMLEALLTAAVENPLLPPAALPLLQGERLRQVHRMSKGEPLLAPEEPDIVSLIRRQAAITPDQIAVQTELGSLTYAELWAQSGALAGFLRDQGIAQETLAGIVALPSTTTITSILGILRAGGAYVPIDPAYPEQRIQALVRDAGLQTVLTESLLREQLLELGPSIFSLDDAQNQWRKYGPPATEEVDPLSLAYVIYTSGSTGKPKGVAVSRENLFSSTCARFQSYSSPITKYLMLSSFAFDSSVAGIFWTLGQGGTLLLPPPHAEKEPRLLVDLISGQNVTHLLALPSLYRALLEESRPGEFSSLQAIIVAGEACTSDLLKLHNDRIPEARLYNEYGPTEGTVWSSMYECPNNQVPEIVPIGLPVPGGRVYLLNRHMRLAPVDVPAEIHIAGGIARGYLGKPELSSACFLPDPIHSVPGARMYRTGDRGRWRKDGTLEFLGRADSQVKIRGYRIEIGEVEAALRSQPQVQDAAVVLRNNQRGEKRLIGYVLCNARSLDPEELGAYLSTVLPEWMVPTTLVPLESFPRTPNGKVDRKNLPSPETVQKNRPAIRPPRNPVEETLVGIWKQVLRVEELGIDDHFIKIGGDSLLGIQVVARAREAGIRITSRLLFEQPTIAGLAEHAELQAGVMGKSRVPSIERAPLSPVQQWFFERDLDRPHHYNQALLLEVLQPLELDLLEQAFHAVMANHEGLRLRVAGESEHRQLRAAPTEENEILTFFELELLPQENRGEIFSTALRNLNEGINFEHGPLLRAAYFTGATDHPYQLFCAIHHLAVDGVSWRILLEDLERSYRALEAGMAPEFADASASFLEWSSLVREWAARPESRKFLAYWNELLLTACDELPADRRDGGNYESALQMWTEALDAGSTQTLLSSLPQKFGATVHQILLAALGKAVAEWSQGSRIRIDCEHHGRVEEWTGVNVDRTIGWFTSIYPVILHFPTATDLPDAIRTAVRQIAPTEQAGFTYGALRYGAGELIDPGRSEILFNYLGPIEAVLSGSSLFRILDTAAGPVRHAQNKRSHQIEIDVEIRDGRLLVEWKYSGHCHQASSIRAMARRHAGILETLCSSFHREATS